MNFTKKELEALNKIKSKSEEGVNLFAERESRAYYTIDIYGKARANALHSAMKKVFKMIDTTSI